MATRHPGISQDLQVLLDAPFFSGLPPQRVGEIVSKGRVIQKRKHGWFFRQDEPATHFYLLVSGGAKICKTTADGEEVLLRIMSPLEIFGYRSINPNGKQLVAIQAAEDSRAVAWTGAAMRRLFLEHPRLALNAFNIAASFMQEFEHRYSELVTEPLEKRIARILLDLAGRMGRNEEGLIVIAEGVLKKDVGRMVGASIFSVSRVFAAWTRQGILQRARGRILLRDMASLQRIAASIVAAIGVMAAHS